MRHISKKKLKEVIKQYRGIKTAICDVLGIADQRTLNGYIERWNLVQFLEEQKYRTQDKVRHNLTKWIDEGNEKVTLWYAEHQMYEEFGNRNTNININTDKDDRTDEEIQNEIVRLNEEIRRNKE